MRGGKIVTSPDGDRWQVSRRWLDRPMPNLGRRFRESRDEATEDRALDSFQFFDLENPVWSVVMVVAILLFAFLVLPLIGVALELIAVFLVISSGVVGRVVLRRPWVIEAVNLDHPERSATFPVKGWRRSGETIEELVRAIPAGQTPLDKNAGSPNSNAIRTTEDAV